MEPYVRHELLPQSYRGARSGIGFEKLSRHLAAEVRGLDLSAPLAEEQREDIARAWAVHGTLVFRGHALSPDDLARFTSQFGSLVTHPAGRFGLEGNPYVTILSNIVDPVEGQVGADRSGMQWHSDRSFRKLPAGGTVLYGLECPAEGADTEFCSAYAAYDRLTPREKELLSHLEGVHDYGWYWRTYQSNRDPLSPDEAGEPIRHPAICSHPVTGWSVLYLSEGVTRTIYGMDEEEGRRLVLKYSDLCGDRALAYAHSWKSGDLVMWDNMAVMHRATDFDNRYARYMLRTQIEGKQPQMGAPY